MAQSALVVVQEIFRYREMLGVFVFHYREACSVEHQDLCSGVREKDRGVRGNYELRPVLDQLVN